MPMDSPCTLLGWSPLFYAAANGHDHIIRQLLGGAAPGMIGTTGLGVASGGRVVNGQMMQEQGPGPGGQKSGFGKDKKKQENSVPASAKSSKAPLDMLRVNIHRLDRRGRNAAHAAAEAGEYRCLRLLHALGCDVGLRSKGAVIVRPADYIEDVEYDGCGCVTPEQLAEG